MKREAMRSAHFLSFHHGQAARASGSVGWFSGSLPSLASGSCLSITALFVRRHHKSGGIFQRDINKQQHAPYPMMRNHALGSTPVLASGSAYIVAEWKIFRPMRSTAAASSDCKKKKKAGAAMNTT